MFSALARTFFGSANERLLKSFRTDVQAVNALEESIAALSDAALAAKTQEFKQKIHQGASLDSLLHEAFAVVREAAKRTLGLRPFDVQLIGGMVLHRGMISEMKTGEGKTLVATLPAYLNALAGKGVHVVTVNDYLARRDAEWMGQVFRFLGLSTGCIFHGLDDSQRRAAYAADITYATNNELGFDYLRDNMKFTRAEMVQRNLFFAIIDEVDSILVDEARTPLIISGQADTATDLYEKVNAVIRTLEREYCDIDEKHRTVTLTEEGQEKVEEILQQAGLLKEGGLYDMQNIGVLHHSQQAVRAHMLFTKDKDYIVKDRKVIIIDEFTGRMMEGRRYSDGLHQAIEAKEGVPVQMENQTLASITFQNYFRLYEKLGGMTGTAMTEAEEFEEIYNLRVVEIPTNIPVARIDEHDEIYRSSLEKSHAIIEKIKEANEKGQPVLVGTVSIAKSEELSAFLTKQKIEHQVLNARHHEKEATIIAQAGRPKAVTIATNMAGRGTDIQLGGSLSLLLEAAGDDEAAREKIIKQHAADKQKVIEAGGLYVIATERHESRRIDNQLRGRSGRQGDPGRTSFYISLEDDLMRIFGSERIDPILKGLGLKENEPIIHPWLNKAIERAQRKVEARNFDIRKNLLKFDNVMNDQRIAIYEQRLEIMDSNDVTEIIDSFRHDVVHGLVSRYIPVKADREQWDVEGLTEELKVIFGVEYPITEWADEEGVAEQEITERLLEETDTLMQQRREKNGVDLMRIAEKSLLMQILDQTWKEHLLTLDHLKQGIGLRSYGQRDPLNEYKKEAFDYFEDMLTRLREQVTQMLSRLEVHSNVGVETFLPGARGGAMMESRAQDPALARVMQKEQKELHSNVTALQPRHTRNLTDDEIDLNDPSTWGRVPRNSPCPCGSGKKYKHCHGLESQAL